MNLNLDTSVFVSGLIRIFSLFKSIATILIVCGVGGTIAYYYYMVSQYKHTILLKRLTGGRKIMFLDKFKVSRSKQGIVRWKTQKRKLDLPPAPAEAIEVNTNGKMFVQAYEYEDDATGYCADKTKEKEIKNAGVKITYGKDDVGEKEVKAQAVGMNEPLTSADRAVMADQFAKSEARMKKDFWKDTLPALAMPISLIVCLTLVLAFWGNIMEPLNMAISQVTNVLKETGDLISKASAFRTCTQALDALPAGVPEVPPT